jgi:hypothetical protein
MHIGSFDKALQVGKTSRWPACPPPYFLPQQALSFAQAQARLSGWRPARQTAQRGAGERVGPPPTANPEAPLYLYRRPGSIRCRGGLGSLMRGSSEGLSTLRTSTPAGAGRYEASGGSQVRNKTRGAPFH